MPEEPELMHACSPVDDAEPGHGQADGGEVLHYLEVIQEKEAEKDQGKNLKKSLRSFFHFTFRA